MREEIDSIGDRTQQVVLPKSELRKTLNYVNNHWLELTRYIDDPQLPMDNNQCEQLMKQVALRRKNGLFAGSLLGGERNAGFLTLVSSVHRNDLDPWRSMAILGDPWRSLDDVLKWLLAGEQDYAALLPQSWAQQHPEAIRHYRQDERRKRNVRQQSERDKRRTRNQLLQRRN